MKRNTWILLLAWVLATGGCSNSGGGSDAGQDTPVDAWDGADDGGDDADGSGEDGGNRDGEEDPGDGDAGPGVDWILRLNPAAPAEEIPTGLLGWYDLSGVLFAYDQVPGLIEAMQQAGFSEWRVGVGRWEAATWMLPTLSDGTPCQAPSPDAMAPAGSTDLDLIAARDWFVDDGQPVDIAATQLDDRYDLAYARSVLDSVEAFGAAPFLDVDLMPRALATNRNPSRLESASPNACTWTFMNQVSNTAPAGASIFALAVEGLVSRLVEGSHGQPGRALTYVELWNEPEFCYFWNPLVADATPCAQDDPAARLTAYFDWSVLTLLRLQEYRATTPAAAGLRLGMGSFAHAETAAAAVSALEGAGVSMDFVSFHGYDNDPMQVVAEIRQVAAAVAAAPGFADTELALAEWGNDLDALPDPGLMDQALHATTVIALGAAAGLDHAHRAIFYAFYPGIPHGMLEHDASPRPLHRAYELMAGLIHPGARRLPPEGLADGELEAGLGAVLAARADDGSVRVLVINRNEEPRTVLVELEGEPATPIRVRSLVDPAVGIEENSLDGPVVTLPPRAIALISL